MFTDRWKITETSEAEVLQRWRVEGALSKTWNTLNVTHCWWHFFVASAVDTKPWIPVDATHISFSSRLLTVAIDSEGCAGGGDLVVTDLAVLWGAVLVCGLHLQDAIVNLALGHRGSVLGLPEHWRELIHIVDLNVHDGPEESRGGKWSLEWNTVSNAQIVTALRTFNLLGWTLHSKISNKS